MTTLDFQDLPYDTPSDRKDAREQTHEFTDFPPDATDHDADQPADSANTGTKPTPSFVSLAFYQQFFDVETTDVVKRVLGSMAPNPKRNYLEHVIRPVPDLYGPFWICVTLTFTIAIAGNVANFIASYGQNFTWKYDFHKVSLAATVIFSYWLIIPVVIWGILRYRGSLAGFTFVEIVCVYGYSLAIFIPISVLWLIQYTWVQWLLAIIGSLLSGLTLLITFWPAVKNDTKQVAVALMFIVMILHGALASGFVLYFFHYDPLVLSPTLQPTASAVTLNQTSYPPGVLTDARPSRDILPPPTTGTTAWKPDGDVTADNYQGSSETAGKSGDSKQAKLQTATDMEAVRKT